MGIKTKAVRMYGAKDLRLEEFTLPDLKEDEILIKIVSDGLCTSSYKMALLGAEHKRVPNNIENHPIIVGHECCGVVEQVGKKWQSKYSPSEKVAIQPALSDENGRILEGVGYSYEFIGGDATYGIVFRFYYCARLFIKI